MTSTMFTGFIHKLFIWICMPVCILRMMKHKLSWCVFFSLHTINFYPFPFFIILLFRKRQCILLKSSFHIVKLKYLFISIFFSPFPFSFPINLWLDGYWFDDVFILTLFSVCGTCFTSLMANNQFHMRMLGIWQQQLAQNTLKLHQQHR